MPKLTERPVPCFVCGGVMGVTKSVAGKPVLTCDPCRIQVFIRGESGLAKFTTKFGGKWGDEEAAPAGAQAQGAPAGGTSSSSSSSSSAAEEDKAGKKYEGGFRGRRRSSD